MEKISLRNIRSGLILALPLLVTGCASSRNYVLEEKEFIALHHLQNTADAPSSSKGDPVAMTCHKCRTVVSKASKSGLSRRFFKPLETRHYCPGCKSLITVAWSGFKSKQTIKHTCESCGDASVFCCATTRESSATEGMEKNGRPDEL